MLCRSRKTSDSSGGGGAIPTLFPLDASGNGIKPKWLCVVMVIGGDDDGECGHIFSQITKNTLVMMMMMMSTLDECHHNFPAEQGAHQSLA